MNRRTLLRTLGATTVAGLAGCSQTRTNQSDQTQTTTDEVQDPVPGKADIHGIDRLEAGEMMLSIWNPELPREVTFELYRHTSSENDAGEWRTQNFEDIGPRPILSFDGEGTRVSQTVVNYDGSSLGGSAQLDFPAEEPAGTPLVYQIDLVEHTLDNQRRTLGYTPTITRNPWTGNYHRQEYNGGQYGFNLHKVNKTHENGKKTVSVHTTSTSSRWETPRIDGSKNRSNGFSNGYSYGMFERPWSFKYTVPDEEADRWQLWNKDRYIGSPSNDRDIPNTRRLFRTSFDNPILARVAEIIDEATEKSGLTSDLAKLRAVADFIQRMEYVRDREIPYGEPRVKHPVTTLYESNGDCEDKVCLAAGLLYQDALPDFTLAAFDIGHPAHVGVAIARDSIDHEGELDSVGDSDEYIYVDVTYPMPIGMVPDDWGAPFITNIHPPGHPDPIEN